MDTTNDCFRGLNNEELIKELMQTCAFKGASIKAEVPDPAFRADEVEQRNKAELLKNLLLARLDKMAPPFQRGDVIMVSNPAGAKPVNDASFETRYLVMPDGKTETVYKVFYEHRDEGGIWLVRVFGRSSFYLATDFSLVNAGRVAPTDDAPKLTTISRPTKGSNSEGRAKPMK